MTKDTSSYEYVVYYVQPFDASAKLSLNIYRKNPDFKVILREEVN